MTVTTLRLESEGCRMVVKASLATLLLLAVGTAWGTSCVYVVHEGESEARLSVGGYDLVFSGSAIEQLKYHHGRLIEKIETVFSVDRIWAGSTDENGTVTITTGYRPLEGDKGFEIGQAYLVLATSVDGGFVASGCSPTTTLERAGGVVARVEEEYARDR